MQGLLDRHIDRHGCRGRGREREGKGERGHGHEHKKAHERKKAHWYCGMVVALYWYLTYQDDDESGHTTGTGIGQGDELIISNFESNYGLDMGMPYMQGCVVVNVASM
jgi:hypothetical protein